ncbi:all-trans retinoic acid-induced differentiation factor-like [Limulus polyphemus]|uniref:All-trans retinoic acid-induced differentiation factor-like n=1 Tax=Limulus polyphemus TaxID=6850 RepID=A0ABM1BBK9_LIMPO|nr:all-trans retinoic acid-induced differentiation factor-like [Limulus polyphemus]
MIVHFYRQLKSLILAMTFVVTTYKTGTCGNGMDLFEETTFLDCSFSDYCQRSYVRENVRKYCSEENLTYIERCCFNKTSMANVLVGLDLSNCTLMNVSDLFKNTTNLVILDLEDNPLLNYTKADFLGLTHLEYLYLPENKTCPGGEAAWSSSGTECSGQLNPCNYLNVSCTENGQCHHLGPGIAKCGCLPGHYGYKCLRQGTFPTLTYCLAICIPTVLFSAFFWFTQRRHVKTD